MEKYAYLPESTGTRDFFIIGSKSGFWAMTVFAALAIIAVCAIILVIRKNRK